MHVQEQIERYVRGELSEEEEEKLWILFLAESEWYDYFITYLNLVALMKQEKELSTPSP